MGQVGKYTHDQDSNHAEPQSDLGEFVFALPAFAIDLLKCNTDFSDVPQDQRLKVNCSRDQLFKRVQRPCNFLLNRYVHSMIFDIL